MQTTIPESDTDDRLEPTDITDPAIEMKCECWRRSLGRWRRYVITGEDRLAADLDDLARAIELCADHDDADALHARHQALVEEHPRWWARVMAARTGHTIEVQA